MRLKHVLALLASVLITASLIAQKRVTGVITSPQGEVLIGVNVLEAGTSNGTTTDLEGAFELSVKEGASLEITYVGYAAQTVTVGDRTNINITLQEGVALDEVVVTALGISREKKSLTYAAQEVGGEELSRVKDANIMNALSGKAPGVVVNRSASGVGGSTRVVLRGNKSTRDNQVLYVVDGIPMLNYTPAQPGDVFGQSNGAGSSGRDGGDGISNLNADDIESMTVLRGASAAALYGSQAANGVILITTKKGKAGSSSIQFSSNLTTESALNTPEMQFSYGQTSNGSLDSWGTKVNSPDHVSDFFQTGTTWINSIALTGGSSTAQTYFSYANTNSKGIVPTSELQRHNFTLRETANFFNDRLTLNGSVNFINQRADNRPSAGLYFNALTGLYLFPRGVDFTKYAEPGFEVFSPNRNTFVQNWTADKDDQQNPYWILNRVPNFDIRNRLMTTASLSLKLSDALSIQARGNMDKSFDTYEQHAYASTQATLANSNGRFILQNNEGTQLYGDVILSLNKNIGNLNVNANLGSSITDSKVATEFFDSFGADLRFANKFSLQNIKQPGGTFQQTEVRQQLQSVFGSLQLGYRSMLYLDVTGRNDWSSTLAYTSNASFFYPSAGVTAVLSEMFDMPSVDFAKVRASYAEVGSGVLPYDTNPLNTISPIGGLQPNTVGPLPGTELQPEISKSFEVGLDLRFLNNRLNFDLTYYSTSTENQRIAIAAPSGSGFSRYIINAGDIENKGIEALITIVPVQTTGFTWNTSFNVTQNKNTVVKLDDRLNDGTFFISEPGVSNYGMALREGGSFGDLFGKQFQRDANGNIVVDGTGKPIPLSGALTFVGNPNPDFMLGWNNAFMFGNFTLNFLIDGRFGGEVMSITRAMMDELGVSQATADARDNGGIDVGAVKEDGTSAGILNAQTFYQGVGGRAGITENYVYDATNIRLRELAVGYNLPKSVVSKLGPVKGLRLSLVGRNLFFIKNEAPFDPDVSFSTGTGLQGVDVFSMPATRSFGFNLSATF